jgi:hypothetical protein
MKDVHVGNAIDILQKRKIYASSVLFKHCNFIFVSKNRSPQHVTIKYIVNIVDVVARRTVIMRHRIIKNDR